MGNFNQSSDCIIISNTPHHTVVLIFKATDYFVIDIPTQQEEDHAT